MDIANVEVLLSAWGRWAVRVETRAIGFASVSPMFREARLGNGFGSSEPIGICDDDMQAIDQAVRTLPVILRATLNEFYKRPCTIRELGNRLGCKHPTAGRYLNEARQRITLVLSEN